jgi:hypothetical protein
MAHVIAFICQAEDNVWWIWSFCGNHASWLFPS